METTSKASQKDAIAVIIIFVMAAIFFIYSTDYFGRLLRNLITSYLLLSLLAASQGRERKIGFTRAFSLSIIFSPLIGLIIALSSSKLSDEAYKEKMLLAAERHTDNASVADELLKLNELRKEGVLTEEEFAVQKAKLLNSYSAD